MFPNTRNENLKIKLMMYFYLITLKYIALKFLNKNADLMLGKGPLGKRTCCDSVLPEPESLTPHKMLHMAIHICPLHVWAQN